MRIDDTEYELAKDAAQYADCSVKEIVELAIRLLYSNATLRGAVSQEELRDMTSSARQTKGLPPSERPHPERPVSKKLAYSPSNLPGPKDSA